MNQIFQSLSRLGYPILKNFQASSSALPALYRGELVQLNRIALEAIYHYLAPGKKLELKYEQERSGSAVVSVWMGKFLLGYLDQDHGGAIAKLLTGHYRLIAVVDSLIKKKFLPPSEISIIITREVSQPD